MKIRNIFLILILSTNYIFSQNEANEENQNSIYIDLKDYEINKQKVDSIPDLDFKDAAINSELSFIPNSKNYSGFYKSKFKGKVKEVTTYRKGNNDSYKSFYHTEKFNENGYKTESEYDYGTISRYFYDANNNLIKDVSIKNEDTTSIKKIIYNKENKIVNIIEKNLKKSDDYEFNLDITIEYYPDGKPAKIINKNPKRSYTKEISYIGNKVIITRKSNSKPTEEKEIEIYSKSFKLLKHIYGYHTIFNTYDENDRWTSSMTYRDDAYCCTDFHKYDDKGNTTNWIFTNHLKDHKEIHTYTYEFDQFGNIIYEHATDNVTNKAYERFYEIEYYNP